MKLSDLDFDYPETLVATEPQRPSRVMYADSEGQFSETNVPDLLSRFSPGDVFVINNSKVEARRLYGVDSKGKRHEVLFVQPSGDKKWDVLCPVSRVSGDVLTLDNGSELKIISRSRPQTVELNKDLTSEDFSKYGEMPLPPYIRKLRGESQHQEKDKSWYQSDWAKESGSSAAPTASLHFTAQDLNALRAKGVNIVEVTLHIGLGTYLPIDVEDIKNFQIHSEWASISENDWQLIEKQKKAGHSVTALGSTSVRVLESQAVGLLEKYGEEYRGKTSLYIQPGFEYKVVDRMFTNFHQPKTSLLAMVSAFTHHPHVMRGYKWAIDNRFRLFSYGDLSVWEKLND